MDTEQTIRDTTAIVEGRRELHVVQPAPYHTGRRSAHGSLNAHRLLDLTVTLLLLPAALVLGAMIAIAILLDSPGPIFYRQRRVGKGGRTFAIMKFRKMMREAAGPGLTYDGDDRFTPVGSFLRASRLDELPQIWNVLKGEMRLVGPRPELPEFVERHRGQYAEILSVVPGLTGPTQLRFSGEHRLLRNVEDPLERYREEIMPTKVALDIRYVRTRSLGRDLLILARTIILPLVVLVSRIREFATAQLPRRRAFVYGMLWLSILGLFATYAAAAGPLR